jgi:hypothetical protein
VQRHVQQGIVNLQCPLYVTKPSLRNLVMNMLTRDLVVPTISASGLFCGVWIAGMTGSVRLSEQFYTDSDV